MKTITVQEVEARIENSHTVDSYEFADGIAYDFRREDLWIVLKSGRLLNLDAREVCKHLEDCRYLRATKLYAFSDFIMMFVIPSVSVFILLWVLYRIYEHH
jgi:hypothetical protein